MIFSDEFLVSLKNEPISGAAQLIQMTRNELVEDPTEWHDGDYDVLMEAYALLLELIESDILQIEGPKFVLTGQLPHDCSVINTWLNQIDTHLAAESSKLKLQHLRSRFKTSLGTAFYYEFSQGDLEKIQALINQLRDLVAQSNHFEKKSPAASIEAS
jgi:hypothetical protein